MASRGRTNPPRRGAIADFYKDGRKDAFGAWDPSDFDLDAGTPTQIVDKAFERWEADGSREGWIEQSQDLIEDAGLSDADAYNAWKSAFRAQMIDFVAEELKKPRDNGRRRRRRNPAATYRMKIGGHLSSGADATTLDGPTVEGLMARGDREYPGVRLEIRSDRTSDGTVWGPGRGRVEATRTAKGKWLREGYASNPGAAADEDYPYYDDVIEGMSRALWVSSYADWAEDPKRKWTRGSHGIEKVQRARGGDWNEAAPATPDEISVIAKKLAHAYRRANECTMQELLERAAAADGRRSVSFKYADAFGHYLAMMSLGSGVSWFDDHARFPLKKPDIEVHYQGRNNFFVSGPSGAREAR